MPNLTILGVLALITCQYCTLLQGEEEKPPWIKTRVIINPKSGIKGKQKIEKLIKEYLNPSVFDFEIFYTTGRNHAMQLSKEAASHGEALVIAVGGDGTVNEVGRGLVGTKTAMAIIPTGSGNGLAGHLKIPSDPKAAIQIINKFHHKPIDTVQINNGHFFAIAGIGFDAHIAWKFAESKRRGFWSYAALVLKSYPQYPSQTFEMEVDGKQVRKEGFLISFANSSQYGNNIRIAPQAKLDDGLLELVILKKPLFYAAPGILMKLRHGNIRTSKYYESIRCKEIKIPKTHLLAHIDGEPIFFEEGVHLKILPKSLDVVIPDKG